MSSTSPRHGAPGCPCEECLTDRIRLTAAQAAAGRDLSGLRARLDGLTGRLTLAETLRSAS